MITPDYGFLLRLVNTFTVDTYYYPLLVWTNVLQSKFDAKTEDL